jgi:uncharacterized protein
MLRYLILALVVVIVVWWLLGRSRKRSVSDRASADKPVSFAVCAHCGVHLPMNEALLDGQRAYCSESHRLAGPRERG